MHREQLVVGRRADDVLVRAARAACASAAPRRRPPRRTRASRRSRGARSACGRSSSASRARPGAVRQIRSSRSRSDARRGTSTAITAGSPGRRRARRAARRRAASAGIFAPGLTCCGSAIQPRRSAGRVRDRQRGERRAASARCVRSGPTPPRAAVPRIVWQPAHACARKTARPARSSAVAGRARRRRHVREPGAERAGGSRDRPPPPCARAGARRTRSTGRGRRPGRSASSRIRFVRPGIRSIFRFSSGIQKLWITSAVVPTTSTRVRDRDVDLVRRDGARARVAHLPPPLVADHVGSSSRVEPGLGAAVERMTKTSAYTKSATSTARGRRRRAARRARSRAARCARPAGRAGAGAPSRGTRSSATDANPIAAPASITHQRWTIARWGLLAGWSTSWLPPQPASARPNSPTTRNLVVRRPRFTRSGYSARRRRQTFACGQERRSRERRPKRLRRRSGKSAGCDATATTGDGGAYVASRP